MSTNAVIIDNCIIFKMNYGSGSRITPISLAKKMYPQLVVDSLPKITAGNRVKDNYIISRLSNGTLRFEDLLIE